MKVNAGLLAAAAAVLPSVSAFSVNRHASGLSAPLDRRVLVEPVVEPVAPPRTGPKIGEPGSSTGPGTAEGDKTNGIPLAGGKTGGSSEGSTDSTNGIPLDKGKGPEVPPKDAPPVPPKDAPPVPPKDAPPVPPKDGSINPATGQPKTDPNIEQARLHEINIKITQVPHVNAGEKTLLDKFTSQPTTNFFFNSNNLFNMVNLGLTFNNGLTQTHLFSVQQQLADLQISSLNAASSTSTSAATSSTQAAGKRSAVPAKVTSVPEPARLQVRQDASSPPTYNDDDLNAVVGSSVVDFSNNQVCTINSDGLCAKTDFLANLTCEAPGPDDATLTTQPGLWDDMWNHRATVCEDSGLHDPGSQAGNFSTASFGTINAGGPNNCFAGYEAVIWWCVAVAGTTGGKFTSANDTSEFYSLKIGGS